MGPFVLGHDHEPRGILVESMDDPGPQLPTDSRQISAVPEQAMDQRSCRVARGRVNDKPWGLVQDNERVVLEDDVKRDRFGFEGCRGGKRDDQTHAISHSENMA